MRLDTPAQIVAKCRVPPGPTQDGILKPLSAALMMACPGEPPNPQSDPPEEKSRAPTTPPPMASSAALLSPSPCPNLTLPNPQTAPTARHDFPTILVLHQLLVYPAHQHRLSLILISTPRGRRSPSTERRRPRFPPVSSVTHWWTNLRYRPQSLSMIHRPRVRRNRTGATRSPHLRSSLPSTASPRIQASQVLSPH